MFNSLLPPCYHDTMIYYTCIQLAATLRSVAILELEYRGGKVLFDDQKNNKV